MRDAIDAYRRAIDRNPFRVVEQAMFEDDAHNLPLQVQAVVARYLGAEPAEVCLTRSTTESLALVYHGLPLRAGEEVLTTVHDHYSHHESIRLATERAGATTRRVALYEDASRASVADITARLRAAIRPETRVVGATWVHSSTGVRLPIREIAAVVRDANRGRDERDRVLLVVDGVHGLGAVDESVAELGCDYFCAGTHKWMFGPRGTGLVWGHPRAWPVAQATIPTFNTQAYDIWMKAAPPIDLPPSIYMTPGGFHSFEHRWALDEAFTFHRAIGKSRAAQRIHELSQQLKRGLAVMPHVTLHTPLSQDLSAGIVCFEVTGMAAREVVNQLRQRGIVGSVTPYAVQYARLAPGLFNSTEEIDTTLEAIQDLHT